MPNTNIATLPAPNNLFLNLNEIDAASPFRDVRVRQAIAYGVDYDAIIKYILFGQGIRTAQIAPGGLGYDPQLKPYPYDPDKARALLLEAGYPAGINVPCYNLTTPREPYIKEVGETIYAYLADVGIRCRIVQLEYGAWIGVGRYSTRPWMDGLQSTMWGQGLPGDPTDAWGGHVHSNGDGWGTYSYANDPELDLMIEQLRRLMDDDERAALIKKIARMKHERMTGGVPTYRPMLTFAWRDTINFEPQPSAFWRSMRRIAPCPSRDCIGD
jgi:peptide/nickel transport system substrate-binding protein